MAKLDIRTLKRATFGPERSVAVVTWGGLGRLRGLALPGDLPRQGWGGAADSVASTQRIP
jgi:hypothetical protein